MIQTHTLDCGLTVLLEPIDSVASCSIHWLVPSGTAHENTDRTGVSTVLSELLLRGAGSRDSRQLSEDMDRIGLERNCGVSESHAWLVGTVLGQHLETSLDLFADVIQNPNLPQNAISACQSLSLQAIESLEDDAQQEVMLHVRRRHNPEPFNRTGYGYLDVIESVTEEELRDAWKAGFIPQGSILGLAGKFDADKVLQALETRLKGWSGSRDEPVRSDERQGGRGHVERDSSQVHIGMAWEGPAAGDQDSSLERLATRILGGSTSGRLFTEVRQRRSLCYSVNAGYRARKGEGVISLYAGTTPERASETLEVCEQEIDRLHEGIDAEELARAKVGMRGSTVFGGERMPGRAASLVGDYYSIGRARTIEDRLAEIEQVDCKALNDYLSSFSPRPRTVVSVGAEPPGEGFEQESPLCHGPVVSH